MGGKAFASGPDALSTPRLPPALYFAILEQTKILLRTVYMHVESPPPAPAKASHGDVDILVCSPLWRPPPSTADLERLLNAKRSLSGAERSFAVPHPSIGDAYVQVDLSVRPDLASWRWQVFFHAFGDMWSLLGSIIRPFGLTANDRGLHVRIKEIEVIEKKKSMIFLTREPQEVCELLGLDTERIGFDTEGLVQGGDGTNGRGFRNMEDMYEFVAVSRFFRKENCVKHTLKSNDRKRMAQRIGYSAFVDDWLPSYNGSERGDLDLTRQKLWEEVADKFDIRRVFEERISAWREERERLKLKWEVREERKRVALDDEAYVAAWMTALERGLTKA